MKANKCSVCIEKRFSYFINVLNFFESIFKHTLKENRRMVVLLTYLNQFFTVTITMSVYLLGAKYLQVSCLVLLDIYQCPVITDIVSILAAFEQPF